MHVQGRPRHVAQLGWIWGVIWGPKGKTQGPHWIPTMKHFSTINLQHLAEQNMPTAISSHFKLLK